MKVVYDHSQLAWPVLITAMLCMILPIIPIILLLEDHIWVVAAFTIPIPIILCVLFYKGRVQVNPDQIKYSFGPGLISKSFHIKDIASVKNVTYPIWYGYGLRIVPGGRLYNVSGTDAVELMLHDGKRVLLGTNDPNTLRNAIRRVSNLKERER